jgi:hypothetical protein
MQRFCTCPASGTDFFKGQFADAGAGASPSLNGTLPPPLEYSYYTDYSSMSLAVTSQKMTEERRVMADTICRLQNKVFSFPCLNSLYTVRYYFNMESYLLLLTLQSAQREREMGTLREMSKAKRDVIDTVCVTTIVSDSQAGDKRKQEPHRQANWI